MNLNSSQVLGGVVDRLAMIKQQIADLKTEESNLKAELIASGETAIDGIYHRAAISECDGRAVIDWHSIAEHFNPSRQLVTAHTTYTDGHYVVRVSARKTS